MTNYTAPKWMYLLLLAVVIFFVYIQLFPNPIEVKITVGLLCVTFVLVIIKHIAFRYVIIDDNLYTKGLGSSEYKIAFTDIAFAYIFVSTEVRKIERNKDSSTSTRNRRLYKVEKTPYIGIEMKNGAVITLELKNMSNKFLNLLEKKFKEHKIYYFEMK